MVSNSVVGLLLVGEYGTSPSFALDLVVYVFYASEYWVSFSETILGLFNSSPCWRLSCLQL